MNLIFFKKKAFSLESFIYENEHQHDRSVDENLSEIISLYDDEDDYNAERFNYGFYCQQQQQQVNNSSTKRLTWEEWYIKKKLEALQAHKTTDRSRAKKSGDRAKLSDEEKREHLLKWLEKKQMEKLRSQSASASKSKKRADEEEKRLKGEMAYEKWLQQLKEAELKKRRDDEDKTSREEAAKKKKLDEIRKYELKKQEILAKVKVRHLKERKGYGCSNGKQIEWFDWSTSPQPSFINKAEWKN